MKSYFVLANDIIIEFKGRYLSQFPGFWGKIIPNYPPSKLFLFTSLPEIISTYTFKILKALKLCILSYLIYFFVTQGDDALDPYQGLCP